MSAIELLGEYGTVFVRAAGVSLLYFACAALAGSVAGILLAVLRTASVVPVRWVAATLVELIRNTPLLVLLLWIHHALSGLLNVHLSAAQSGAIALTICAAAYFSEVFHAGLAAVPQGQRDAAHALGMSWWSTLRRVLIPQASRRMLPALTNTLLMVWKATSILSILGIAELTRIASRVTQTSGRPLHGYSVAALGYVTVSLIILLAVRRIESRWHTDGVTG